MPPATNEEQFRFLISCIRWSNNGRVDFQEVANECGVVSKGAAAKRYERMMRAHGIHPSGGPAIPSPGSSPSVPRARQPKASRDGSDRYGKGRSKADKAKAKQAMFAEEERERSMDVDDEELDGASPSPFDPSLGGIKDENGGIEEAMAMEQLVVKSETPDPDVDGDGERGEQQEGFAGSAYGGLGDGRRDGDADMCSPRTDFAQTTASSSDALGAESMYWNKPTPATAYGLTTPPSAIADRTQSPGTLPHNGFDFNAYTPRQVMPGSFFGGGAGSGVRTPEEVHEDLGVGVAISQVDGSSSPKPAHGVNGQGGETEVILLD